MIDPRAINVTHPFFDRVMTFVTYEEIYKESISYQNLVFLIKSLPVLYWVRLASMGHMLLEHQPTKPSNLQAQAVIYKDFFPKTLLDSLNSVKDDVNRAIVHEPQLLALMRLALLHGNQFEIQENDELRRDITSRCLLGISSLIYVRRDQKQDFDTGELSYKLTFDSKKEFSTNEKTFLMSLLQLYFNHSHEHIGNLIGRYKDMTLDIPNEPDFIPNGVSRDLLQTYIQRELGFSLTEYASLTFGVIAKYLNPDGLFKKDNPFWIDRNYFSKTSLNPDLVQRYFSTILQSQSDYIQAQKARGDPEATINDFTSFMLKPLVHLDNSNEYYPTSLTYLQRLMESGLVWVVSGGQFKSDLRNYWGQVFEHYCHKICKRIEANSKIKPKYFPEQTYQEDGKTKKSCDAIFICNDKAVIMEFKVKFIDQRNLLNANFDAFVADLHKFLIESDDGSKAATQIDATIRSIRSSHLILPGVNAKDIKNYYPLIVTLQSWPKGPFIYEVFRREVQKNRLLPYSYVAPLEIWSAEEFEYVETLLSSESIGIASLINNKLISQYKTMSAYVFLYDKYSDKLTSNSYLRTKTEEVFEIVKNTLRITS